MASKGGPEVDDGRNAGIDDAMVKAVPKIK